jgi:hypothetical protein
MFVGLTTAPDKTMTVAVSGPVEGNLNFVSIVLRLRDRQNAAHNARVLQTLAICRTVTRLNVTQDEFLKWLDHYLITGAKSDPVFRNGWSIKVSGTIGEGSKDPKRHLGEAVLVELKK